MEGKTISSTHYIWNDNAMSLPTPILDDRSYEQLRKELIERIPVYNKEWTDHNASDPGITLLELFSHLGESILHRFNQIPEKTYLEYLNLLQINRTPATSARALLSIENPSTNSFEGILVHKGAEAKSGDVSFESIDEITAWPVSIQAICKSQTDVPDPADEQKLYDEFIRAVDAIEGIATGEVAASYENKVVSQDGKGESVDFSKAVDNLIWIAVINNTEMTNTDFLDHLVSENGATLNIGYTPDATPPNIEEIEPCPGPGMSANATALQWEISTGQHKDLEPQYEPLQVVGDATDGLRNEGVIRLKLPSSIEVIGNFVLPDDDLAGAGDWPPSLDDETNEKVLFWMRGFFHNNSTTLGLIKYIGVNTTSVIQSKNVKSPEFLGTGNGQAYQEYTLANSPVIKDSLTLEVEGPDGWQTWLEVDGFHATLNEDRHYTLDRQKGAIRFGNKRVPQIGQRIRATTYKYGGGISGNVAAGSITKLEKYSTLKPGNPLVAYGGSDDESIEDALARIPAELNRRNRAVTNSDFSGLAKQTPGADIARAECLSLYRARTGETNAAGCITVVVWPTTDNIHPQAPVPTRKQLKQVCECLDDRRLVTTEVYVVPPRYRKIAVAVGLKVKTGFGVDAVRYWVELVIRQYLAPLPPYGPEGNGWPMGRRVYGPELEAAALQVEGVEYLEGLNVAWWDETQSRWLSNTEQNLVELNIDEVVELSEITVIEGEPLDPGDAIGAPETNKTPVPIPITRDEC